MISFISSYRKRYLSMSFFKQVILKKFHMVKKTAMKTLVHQRDQSDCGVACLASIIRYYGGQAELERLRELSGTSRQGTTLLGLYQAAKEFHLKAGAYESNIDHLKKFSSPTIIHVIKDKHLLHYIICYAYKNGRFIIGDPSCGVSEYTPEELESIWESKSLLLLEVTNGFMYKKQIWKAKYKWIHQLVKYDLHILTLAFFLGIVIAILGLSTALFSQTLIDRILPYKNITELIAGLILLTILLWFRSILSYIRGRFLLTQSRDFNNRIIGGFFDALVHLPQPFFYSRKTGDLIARMNDTNRLQSAVTHILGNVMIDALILIVSAIFVFIYSVPLGFICLLSLPLIGIFAWLYHRPIVKGQQEVMAAHAINESNYVDAIQGMETIKALNKEHAFSDMTKTIYGFFQDRIFTLGKIGIRFNIWTECISVILSVAVLAYSAVLVLDGRLQIGQLVAVLQMSAMLIPAAMSLALTNLRLQEARVAFDRMYEFASLQPEYKQKLDKQECMLEIFENLEVRAVSFRFPGCSELLRNISFCVNRGEIVTILGESGCGKTTMLQILQRFYRPTNGDILLNNTIVSWKQISTNAWRKVIGVVPQQIKIFNGSVIDNICLGNIVEEAEEVINFCKHLGFDRFFSAFPQGYITLLGEEGVNISGGQRQLVALARAMYKKPQLLLLDEATAAMDRDTERFILTMLRDMRKEIGVVLVTHRAQVARYGDHIYIFENGQVTSAGKPEALALGDNLFAKSLMDFALMPSNPFST